MNVLLLLDMAASGGGDQIALQSGQDRLTATDLLRRAWSAAQVVGDATALAYAGTNGPAFPIGLFAAAAAGVPFAPMNYRLNADQLHEHLVRLGEPVVVADGELGDALAGRGHRVLGRDEFLERSGDDTEVGEVPGDGDAPAVLLFTSGTTAAPKIAILRHRHLTSYVIGTVEFAGADHGDAALVSVPPYHVAGLANLLSNLYGGRRIVYLDQFDARTWVDTVRAERVTHAMVVPTMMARVADVLEADDDGLPGLRALSYGGSRTPSTTLQRIMALLPDTDLTNAYGLTETSSTIAVLGPDDHRAARDGDPVAVARLGSAGKVLPTVEVEIRKEGEVWVRGEQVSGEYDGTGSTLDPDGWFPTRDRGWLDDDGYLFIEGRSDDTIIRGGENISPAEIEEVLLRHPSIRECAVVGVPDDEWGQCIAAVVVARPGAELDPDEVRAFARKSLRSSRTPDDVHVVDELPYTDTGKLLRRRLADQLDPSAGTVTSVSAMSQVPFAPDVFTWPAEEPQLIGGICRECGSVTFPAPPSCARCGATAVDEHLLPTRGTLWTFTTQEFLPKEPYAGGETAETFNPYGVGLVELGDEVRVEGRLTQADVTKLHIGMEVRLVIVPLRVDPDGTEVMMFAFEPV